MRDDTTRAMPQHILTILEAHAHRSEASAKRALEVVNTDPVQARSCASFLPGGVQLVFDRRASEGEHVGHMLATPGTLHRGSRPLRVTVGRPKVRVLECSEARRDRRQHTDHYDRNSLHALMDARRVETVAAGGRGRNVHRNTWSIGYRSTFTVANTVSQRVKESQFCTRSNPASRSALCMRPDILAT
jgi:hypothetical protein